MTRTALAALLATPVLLSGCVVDAGGDWSDEASLVDRTRLARETCGEGRVASVDEDGFRCTGAEGAED